MTNKGLIKDLIEQNERNSRGPKVWHVRAWYVRRANSLLLTEAQRLAAAVRAHEIEHGSYK